MRRARVPSRVPVCAAALLLLAGPGESADPPKDPSPKPPAAKVNLDDYLLPDPDVEWLKRSKVPSDSPGLVRFLKSCQGAETPPAEIEALVGKLMGGPAAEREAAAKKLAEVGTIAVPALRRHRTGPDAEAAKRVRECLERIEEAGDKPLARPVMRLLVARRAAGAAEALIGYLPFASDPAAEEDVYYGLDALAERDPKVLGVLAGALKDPQPARRAVAACILGRRGDAAHKQAVRDLLKDRDSMVRLRAAQGLLAGRNKNVLPALIDLLDDAAVEVRWQAEELLRWAAIDTAPAELAGSDDPKARRACQAAWRKWWAENGAKLDLAEVEKEPRRPLLLLGYDRKTGRVWVFGSDGATRWEWATKENLADAQYVPGGTVLTLHEQPVRQKPLLAEWDREGKVLWQYDDMRDPASIQRLPNGRVFVAERQAVDPRFWYQVVAAPGRKAGGRPDHWKGLEWLISLRYLPDGRILGGWIPDLPTRSLSGLRTYDRATNSEQTLPRFGSVNLLDRIQVEETAEGYLLSGLSVRNRVTEKEIVEVAQDGFGIWSFQLPGATHATRLRDGNTVACLPQRLVEASLDKRIVADAPFDRTPTVARPCLQLIRLGFPTRSGDFDLANSVEARVRGLTSPSVRSRRFALERLADLGPDAAGVMPEIETCQKDPDPSVREAARRAMLAAGLEEIPRLKEELRNADPQRRLKALPRLGDYCRAPGVIPALIEMLGDKDPVVRGFAASVLGSGEPSPQRRTPHWLIRGRLRGNADVIVPALLRLSNDPDEDVRWRVTLALGMMGAAGKRAVPYLLNVLKTETPKVRVGAIQALGHIGPVRDDIIPALLSVLKGPDLDFRARAATALGHMGPAARAAVKDLIAADAAAKLVSNRQGWNVRWAIMIALGQIGEPSSDTVPFLLEVIQQPVIGEDNATASFAARSLVEIGTPAAKAIPVLRRLSQAGDDSLKPTFRRCALTLEMAVWLAERGRSDDSPKRN